MYEAGSSSLAWSMVAGTNGWAQVGYLKNAQNPTRYFWQWTGNASTHPVVTGVWGSPPETEFRRFKVERLPSDGHLHMFVAGNEAPCNNQGDCAETNFDPLNAWDSIHAEWFGETTARGSDMPGIRDHKVDFKDIRWKEPGDVWNIPDPLVASQSPSVCFYRQNKLSDEHIKIWTYPLNHNC